MPSKAAFLAALFEALALVLSALPTPGRAAPPVEVRAYVPLDHGGREADAFRVIDVNSGLFVHDIALPAGPLFDVAALPDGSRIYTTDQENGRILCLETWSDTFVDTFYAQDPYLIEVNRQGTLLAAASGDSLWVFELPSGEVRWRRQSPAAMTHIFFPPDVTRVLMMREECYEFDLESGELLQSVPLPYFLRDMAYSAVTGKLYMVTREALLTMDPDLLELETIRLFYDDGSTATIPYSVWLNSSRGATIIGTGNPLLSMDLRTEVFSEIRLTNLTGLHTPPPPNHLAMGPVGNEIYFTTSQAGRIKAAAPWWEPWWDIYTPTFVIVSATSGEVRTLVPLPANPIGLLTAVRPVRQPADFDYDRDVDFADFLVFASAYGSSTGAARWEYRTDLNSDGTTDFDDFLMFAEDFGSSY